MDNRIHMLQLIASLFSYYFSTNYYLTSGVNKNLCETHYNLEINVHIDVF